MEPVSDARHLLKVDHNEYHAERPGFRIAELRISPGQEVPWHCHTDVQDTFYVLEGRIAISLRDPDQMVVVERRETHTVRPGCAHRVTTYGELPATFLVLQAGQYDFVPLPD